MLKTQQSKVSIKPNINDATLSKALEAYEKRVAHEINEIERNTVPSSSKLRGRLYK